MLDAQQLSKSYTLAGKRTINILQGVTLRVHEGEMVTIVGASGSGKTTLLNLLGTLDTPDSGTIVFNNQPLFQNNRYTLSRKALAAFRNRQIGFVFQFHHLLSDFTALENVAMAEFIATGNLQAAKVRAAELLTNFGLSERLDHLPSELSGGEQQRVAIARALMNNPKLVLADEPSGNLDQRNSQLLYELMARISKEQRTAFIIVTHNYDYAAMADRCFCMENGLLGEYKSYEKSTAV